MMQMGRPLMTLHPGSICGFQQREKPSSSFFFLAASLGHGQVCPVFYAIGTRPPMVESYGDTASGVVRRVYRIYI